MRLFVLAFLATMFIWTSGCFRLGGAASPSAPGVPAPAGFFHNLFTPPTGTFGVLDVIASFCAVGAAAAIVTWFFAPNFVSGKMAAALGTTAVGAWVVKIVLVKLLWLVATLSIIGLVLFGMAFAYGHVAWLERTTGLDLNRDGKVG